MMAAPFKLDAAGENFIAEHEGEVLYVYNDKRTLLNRNPKDGNATFGIGHLVHEGPVTKADRRKYGSQFRRKPAKTMLALSRQLFKEDAAIHERAVLKHVPERWRDTQGRFNALVSLSFNLGTGILTPEPPLVTLGQALRGPRNPEQRKRIAAAILLYDTSGGKRMLGLTRRRRDEADLFVRSWR